MQEIPALGMGTYRLKDDVAYASVTTALNLGYRHIDTAQLYENEEAVGRAIADSDVSRDELFITTKVWMDKFSEEKFLPSVEESLTKLQLDRVDLLLVHWPDESGAVAMDDYLAQLKAAQDKGYTKHIGVSNFTNAQLDQAISILGEGVIYTNQVEVQPFLQNQKVIAHCKERKVRVTSYMPLAVGKVMDNAVLQDIASELDVSPAQVALAWQFAQGLITIPSSTKESHLQSNLEAQKISLTDEHMKAIATLECNDRIANPDFAPKWD
ncbi:2,5-didehydrogluconate reductase DkgB [Teredinibacter turnerae]|uniref:2,5-didehydrogluconate reductase DkgB n=1 Tax=Teredinibacter turnerae TaxID=2426 RepID=UPI000368BFF0|nr:2,5-didehydrogluconate reductase DkgB [Teredinibacter turnerae]